MAQHYASTYGVSGPTAAKFQSYQRTTDGGTCEWGFSLTTACVAAASILNLFQVLLPSVMEFPLSRGTQSPLRRKSATSVPGTPENLTPELVPNDDESEKRQRRLTLITEKQITQSPRGSYNPFANLNAVEQAEHYQNCMKLSAGNKITAKNAFQLLLIDYMAMMLKKEEPQMDNFQVASCTLDASAKIYACRVDNVHNDTCKLAASFYRAGKRRQKDGDIPCSMEEENRVGSNGSGKYSKKRRSSMIEKNLDRINLKEKDEECDKADHYFRRMAAKFDEGQSGGCHLFQNLRFLDDSQEYKLASDACWWRERQPRVQNPSTSVRIPTPNFNAINSAEICPAFSSFTFVGWKPELDVDGACNSKSEDFEMSQVLERDSEHAFDMDAVPEDIPMDGNDDLSEGGLEITDDLELVEKLCCIEKEKKSSWDYVSLRKSLSLEPQEYSYFNKAAQVGWSGPIHWKVEPILRKSADGRASMKRKAKDRTYLEYEEPNNDDSFKVSKRKICLNTLTTDKWSEAGTTLPQDLNIYPSSLLRLFLKPNVALKTKNTSIVTVEGVEPFNFDNTNDREDYCSNIPIDEDLSESSLVLHELGMSQLPDVDQLTSAASGYDLVPAPHMVKSQYMSYVKLPKKLNMKRLQEVIYKILTTRENSLKDKEANTEEVEVLADIFKFSEVYKKIPAKLPSQEAKSLSIPIAFVALLHLANSKSLDLHGCTNLDDVIISHVVHDQ